AGTQSYPYLWSKMAPYHVGGRVKGRTQALWYRMDNVPGLTRIPIIRQTQLFFEADVAGIVNGVPTAARVPFANLQGSVPYQSDSGTQHVETPKVWLPPYWIYSIDVWHRFLNADGGHWQFGVPRRALLNDPSHQHQQHSIDAFYQGRRDMQRLEHFLDSSTLVEDPEVQLAGVGDFIKYDGPNAFQNNRPAYSLRHWTVGGTTQIEIIGSHPQTEGASRTDKIRVPGLFGGCVFKVTLTGPSAQIFSFVIPAAGLNSEIETGNVSAGNLSGYGGLARLSAVVIPEPEPEIPEEPEEPGEPDPTPTTYVPAQEHWRRIHGTSWAGSDFQARKDEALRWKQRGSTMFKFTIEPEQWYNPAAQANMIAFAAYCRSIGLKVGVHHQYSFYRSQIGSNPAISYMTLDKAEKFNSNSGLDVYPDTCVPVSLAFIRPWVDGGAGWDNNNPMKRISVDVVQDSGNKIKPDTVSVGRTEEYEMGIGNKVSPLTQARVGLYEDPAKQWFKDKVYAKAGGTLAQVRTMVNRPSLTDAEIVPPVIQYYNDGDGFHDTWNGDGTGGNWNRRYHWEFGVWTLTKFLDMFAYYANLGNPGQHITVEAGANDNRQSVAARTFQWKTLTKTANATQVNLAPDANWARGADIHGSRIKYFGADWDNIWDPVNQKYKKNYSVPNGQGDISQDQAADRIAAYVIAGGSWGYFGGQEANLVELHNKVKARVGNRLGGVVPNVNRNPTVQYFSGKMRKRENEGLDNWKTAGTNLEIVEETPLFT
ncbi:hypothetical protein, partial [Larkinella ripae]